MNLLVAIDFSGVTERIVAQAKLLAEAFEAKIWLIYVAEPEPDFVGYSAGPKVVRNQVACEYHEEHRRIQAHADLLRDAGIEVEALLIQGGVVDSIVQQAEKLGAAMIVMGSHGHNALMRLVVGDVADGVLRRAPCVVHIVPAHLAV